MHPKRDILKKAVTSPLRPVWRRCRGLLAWLLLLPVPVAGAGWDAAKVEAYFTGLESFHAQFTQRVVDSEGVVVQSASGEVWIKRPGRFRWNYAAPFEQQVVADGKRLWTYDPELEQATVKPVTEVLSITPAVLLSGLRPFKEMVTVQALGRDDTFRLLPVDPQESVQGLRVSFAGDQLASIHLKDSFGNTTDIRFSDPQLNRPVADSVFRVELPDNTDLLGAE